MTERSDEHIVGAGGCDDDRTKPSDPRQMAAKIDENLGWSPAGSPDA